MTQLTNAFARHNRLPPARVGSMNSWNQEKTVIRVTYKDYLQYALLFINDNDDCFHLGISQTYPYSNQPTIFQLGWVDQWQISPDDSWEGEKQITALRIIDGTETRIAIATRTYPSSGEREIQIANKTLVVSGPVPGDKEEFLHLPSQLWVDMMSTVNEVHASSIGRDMMNDISRVLSQSMHIPILQRRSPTQNLPDLLLQPREVSHR